jgi:hypothetical protein
MVTDNSLADDTGSSQNNNQDTTERTYTQKEFDDHMARMKASVSKKYEKTLSELGDLDELRSIKSEYEKKKLDEQKRRGEFETILKNLADSKDQEIKRRDEIIRNYTVEQPLVNLAAEFGAVNPAQVKTLLKPYVRLADTGDVEVIDDKGSVRYSDKGTPLGVQDLVKEFLDTNLHFKAAGPATTNGRNNVSQTPQKVDPTKLDMKNPAHRRIYKEMKFGGQQ